MEVNNTLKKETRFRAFQEIYFSISYALLIANFLVNGFIFTIIVCKQSLRRTLSNIIIANLLLTMMFVNLIAVLYNFQVTNVKAEMIQTAILPFFMALIVMAIDRFLCIRFPFQYQNLSYRKSITLIVVTIWFPFFVWFPITECVNRYEFNLDLTEIVITISAMIILIIANTYVYSVALCHHRKISTQKKLRKSSTENSFQKPSSSRIWRSLLISFLLTASFIVGFTMNLVIRILRLADQISLEKEIWLNRINYPILNLKNTVCPIICVALNKSLRKAVRTIIWRRKTRESLERKRENHNI